MNFSFSSGASFAHNAGGWVLPLCIYPQPTDISHKEVDKRDGRRIKRSFYAIVERFFLDALQKTDTFVSICCTHDAYCLFVNVIEIRIMVINSIAENPCGGDDEKLIINDLGPYRQPAIEFVTCI